MQHSVARKAKIEKRTGTVGDTIVCEVEGAASGYWLRITKGTVTAPLCATVAVLPFLETVDSFWSNVVQAKVSSSRKIKPAETTANCTQGT